LTAVLPLHGARAHSELGASGMSRWSKCPASVALMRHLPNKAGMAAERGTACHEIAEAMLAKRLMLKSDQTLYGFQDDHPLGHYIGRVFNGITIDEDLAETAQAYVNECLKILQPGDRVWIERQFDLAALDPPAEMFGTADLVIYRASEKRLIVIDLKSGAGIVVHAVDNSQLRYYALGAMLSLPGLKVGQVEMVIVQPRVAEPVKRDVIDSVDLLDWSAELLDAARATQAPDAPAIPGEHCRFCIAKRACIKYELHALDAARDEFDVIEGSEISVAVPDPAELSAEDLARRLALIPLLKDWIKTMEAFAFQRLNRGDAIPGFKLVAKNARRKWRDDSQAVDWLLSKGLTIYDAVKQTPITPARAEEMIRDRTGIAALVTSESSGPTLVPDTDRRPAITGLKASEEFDVIEDFN
jgi:hypothetical protein